MSATVSEATFALARRAALDVDGELGYPARVEFVDIALEHAADRVWTALHDGCAVVLAADGLEVLYQPVERLRDRLRGRIAVRVQVRPLVLDGPPAAATVQMTQTLTRRDTLAPLAPA